MSVEAMTWAFGQSLPEALKEQKKETMSDYKMREQAIVKEINRLALDVRTGQSSLYPKESGGADV